MKIKEGYEGIVLSLIMLALALGLILALKLLIG